MIHDQEIKEQKTAQQKSESAESEGGMSFAPPTFNLTASGDPPIQRQDAGGQNDVEGGEAAAPDPFAGLTEDHRNPLLNSNTSEQNLVLLIEEWEANDSTNDDRKLANILATAILESGRTFQSVNENLAMNYFPGYAPSGYWGRGFVQLTHDYNYEGMGDELGYDMEDHPETAILPTISAYVTANGMLDGDFTGRALNRYLPVSENEEGERVEGNSDWFNARRVVNGVSSDPNNWSHQAAEEISETSQAIYADIQAYRAGIADESIAADVTLATYLYDQTNNFEAYKDSDALRIVEALGHMDFQTPNMSAGTEMQQSYQDQVGEAGHASSMMRINNDTERQAIRAFQVAFNQNHHLVTPLPETGQIDDRTHEMMMLDGNRIAAGNTMIEAAYGGEVQAINLYEQAYTNYQAGTLSLNGLALEIHSYMPAQNSADVLGIFDGMGGNAVGFAYALARAGHTHDRLAYINPDILARMSTLLTASSAAAHQTQAQRVNAVINYSPVTPDGEYITHVVARGEYLSTIAQQYGMSYQELGELNNIPPPYNAISVGQELRVPNPDFDPTAVQPDAPQIATTIEPLVDHGPAPEPTTNPHPEVVPDAGTGTAPATEQDAGAGAGGGGGGMGGALRAAWDAVMDFLSSFGG